MKKYEKPDVEIIVINDIEEILLSVEHTGEDVPQVWD